MPFIVLEGLDGAGKSTQVALLRNYLDKRGIASEFLHFPRFDAPVFGELVARFLRGEFGNLCEVNPYLVALVFAVDRSNAANIIREWLDQGKWVLVDRYVYSNIGYQCAKLDRMEEREELRRWIMALEYEQNTIPRPDVSIFLDVPFSFTENKLTKDREGDDRSYLNGEKDIHEASLELQRRVRDVYLWVAQSDPGLRIADCTEGDGSMGSPEANFRRIMDIIKDYVCVDVKQR